jgi:Xaa-Pro aminopeptidase
MTDALKKLRALMAEQHLDFYLVPGADPHQTEYVPPYWQHRTFISGFTGSNGNILIGKDQAYLWTDGRYTLQAKLELDPKTFTQFDYGQDPNIIEFLSKAGRGKRVGADASTLTYQYAKKLQDALHAVDSELIFTSEHLVNAVWTERPKIKHTPVVVYPLKFAGAEVKSKLAILRAFMQEQILAYVALNELPGIAWLFNIRGHDAEHTPLVFSYALISQDQAQLYVAETSQTPELLTHCQEQHFTLKPYEQFYQDLTKLKNVTIGLDLEANALMYANLQKHNTVRVLRLPIMLAKACKNKVELQGMVNAHIEDGAALIRFFTWLETHWQSQTEITIADKLQKFREQSPLFYSLSFPTIAGFKDHGAIIHYQAQKEIAHKIGNDGILLLDSGAQYWGGTTDVTRTFHLGTPSTFEQECYTLVLKGHLALRHATFPHGTRGNQLDSLARQYLWQKGFDYAHGTGHGVGAFLNVHEGPQSISTSALNTTALLPDMITSNEPGVYFEGQFGIRIENLCYVKISETQTSFYSLEDLTLVPYCRKLINVILLTPDEIRWINEYHQKIYTELAPRLDQEAEAWLKTATQAL